MNIYNMVISLILYESIVSFYINVLWGAKAFIKFTKVCFWHLLPPIQPQLHQLCTYKLILNFLKKAASFFLIYFYLIYKGRNEELINNLKEQADRWQLIKRVLTFQRYRTLAVDTYNPESVALTTRSRLTQIEVSGAEIFPLTALTQRNPPV